jgi:transcriptional regulator with XRE-family HTH domain
VIEPIYRQLGARIRQLRLEAKLSQVTVAKALGLTRASMANIELAKQRLYAHQIVELSGVLGQPIESIMRPGVYKRSPQGMARLPGGRRPSMAVTQRKIRELERAVARLKREVS